MDVDAPMIVSIAMQSPYWILEDYGIWKIRL